MEGTEHTWLPPLGDFDIEVNDSLKIILLRNEQGDPYPQLIRDDDEGISIPGDKIVNLIKKLETLLDTTTPIKGALEITIPTIQICNITGIEGDDKCLTVLGDEVKSLIVKLKESLDWYKKNNNLTDL